MSPTRFERPLPIRLRVNQSLQTGLSREPKLNVDTNSKTPSTADQNRIPISNEIYEITSTEFYSAQRTNRRVQDAITTSAAAIAPGRNNSKPAKKPAKPKGLLVVSKQKIADYSAISSQLFDKLRDDLYNQARQEMDSKHHRITHFNSVGTKSGQEGLGNRSVDDKEQNNVKTQSPIRKSKSTLTLLGLWTLEVLESVRKNKSMISSEEAHKLLQHSPARIFGYEKLRLTLNKELEMIKSYHDRLVHETKLSCSHDLARINMCRASYHSGFGMPSEYILREMGNKLSLFTSAIQTALEGDFKMIRSTVYGILAVVRSRDNQYGILFPPNFNFKGVLDVLNNRELQIADSEREFNRVMTMIENVNFRAMHMTHRDQGLDTIEEAIRNIVDLY